MRKIRIGIIEKESKILTATAKTLDKENLFEIVLAANDLKNSITDIQTKNVDVLVIGFLPSSGHTILMELYALHPNLKIIFYACFDGLQNVIEMGRLGVKSFVRKHKYRDLSRAIRIVHEGGVFLPDEFSFIMQKHVTAWELEPCKIELSNTERLLLISICKGLSSSQIADQLLKSPRTIEKYRQDLYNKFGVERKEQLILKALRLSFLQCMLN